MLKSSPIPCQIINAINCNGRSHPRARGHKRNAFLHFVFQTCKSPEQRRNGTKEKKKDEIQSTLDSLLAEVDQQIRFSICLDEEIKEAELGRGDENNCDRKTNDNDDDDNGEGDDNIRSDLSAMKRSIDVLRSQLTSTKANLVRVSCNMFQSDLRISLIS